MTLMKMTPEEFEKYEKSGYKKPPKHAQFKKGQSGNPKGRPKQSKSLNDAWDKAFFVKKKVKLDGKGAWLTVAEIGLMQLAERFMKGDPKAIKFAFPHLQKRAQEIIRPPVVWINNIPRNCAKCNEDIEEKRLRKMHPHITE